MHDKADKEMMVEAESGFLVANSVEEVEKDDEIYSYDEAYAQRLRREKPWTKNYKYFTSVKVSAVALLKMVMHCASGGKLEVMGLLQGKVVDRCFIIMDAFPVPGEASETSVVGHDETYRYMAAYAGFTAKMGRKETVVGWYHSHPGLGCFLSGVDVAQQRLNQQLDPYCALVIDPHRTIAQERVEIGAYRAFPEGYTEPGAGQGLSHLSSKKMADLGYNSGEYYSMPVSYFRSSLDARMFSLLWNKYWVGTLSSSRHDTDAGMVGEQIADLADMASHAEVALGRTYRLGMPTAPRGIDESQRSSVQDADNPMYGLASQTTKLATEQLTESLRDISKTLLFGKNET